MFRLKVCNQFRKYQELAFFLLHGQSSTLSYMTSLSIPRLASPLSLLSAPDPVSILSVPKLPSSTIETTYICISPVKQNIG